MFVTIFTIYHSKSDVDCSQWLVDAGISVPGYTVSWHTCQGQESHSCQNLRLCLVYGDDEPWNTWTQCIIVHNATRANSRLPTRSRQENDVKVTPDVSKSNCEEVWQSAVKTNDKKNAAGSLNSETRRGGKKPRTNDYCIGIHTDITQLYTKTYCWQHNLIFVPKYKQKVRLS